jgi:outer membrane protein assembly factor BamD (BamD/ComL family)
MENMKRGVKNIESKQSFQSLYEDFSKEESDKKDLMPMVNLLKAMTADADAKKLNADLDLIFVTFVKSNIHGSS